MLKPDLEIAYCNRGSALGEIQEYSNAISDFTKAIELKPDYAEAYNYRGLAYIKAYQDYKNAITEFTTAIELNPLYSEAYHKRGIAYAFLGKAENACNDWEKASLQGYEESKILMNKICK